ncbi:hypothetical protein AMC83_CH01936 [Rhizobium phaseoli]|nr:hypothetical protein AMC83_CH01936 [Rhizobium phaseoli]
MKYMVILCTMLLAACNEERPYPFKPVSQLELYRSYRVTIAEFKTSRGDYCVAVENAGLDCEWRAE